jgi:hypothetical protein
LPECPRRRGFLSCLFVKKLAKAPALQSVLIVATSVLCLGTKGIVIYNNMMVLLPDKLSGISHTLWVEKSNPTIGCKPGEFTA